MTNPNFSTEMSNELYQIILEEIAGYDFLYEILEKQQDAVIVNDLTKLQSLRESEQLTIRKVKMLTEARMNILKVWFQEEAKGDISMLTFIDHFDNKERDSWLWLNNRLMNVVGKIKEANNRNKLLLVSALRFTQNMIQLLYPEDTAMSKLYNQKGVKSKQISTSNFVDCNV